MHHQKIAVLDFGGQYAHLIANRIRRLGVYSEIFEPEVDIVQLKDHKGIVLSGGPMSVYKDGPTTDPKIFELGVPVLGICYGHQLMQHLLGGKVEQGRAGETEYGLADVKVINKSNLFADLPDHTRVWMSHGDNVVQMAPGFSEAGQTKECANSAVFNPEKKFFGVQFHPEVTHSADGMQMLDNFLNTCQVKRTWSIDEFIQEEVDAIQVKVGDKKVFLLCSGGVDSTVAFALLEKALGKDRVYGLLVDTGLMRKEEAAWVKKSLNEAGFANLHVADKGDLFLSKLAGKFEPEEKRKIIGDLFWEVKESVAEELKLNPDEWLMGQGTIYPDTIETGGTKHADTIKTHHNRVDLVQEMIAAGKVIEPLAQLYKDEVRDLGEKLGLPHELVWRHPFPGPGLGVRILCVGEKESADQPDFSDLNQLITDFISKEFDLNDVQAVVLPVKSVGVQGDGRTYRHPVTLFTNHRDWDLLERISTAITNQFSQVNRVTLALAGELGDFKIHETYLSEDRVKVLQQADDYVAKGMSIMDKNSDQVWQFPVILAPVSTEKNNESIVLRPVNSTEAMTASFSRLDSEGINKVVSQITSIQGISHVFYDLTHKPPGTIEWE